MGELADLIKQGYVFKGFLVEILMEENNSFQEIWDKLLGCKKVLISLHAGPDGDSLGSCSAMKKVLEREGVDVRLVSSDPLSSNISDFDYTKEVEMGTDLRDLDLEEYSVVLFLDSGIPFYKLGNEFKIPKNIFVINIDHHPSNTYYGNLNYVDSEKASVCSILIDFFKEVNVDIDKEIADRLLLGVSTDSLFFTTEFAERAIGEAAFLINKGGDYIDILNKVLLNKSLRLEKYFALLFNNLKIKGDIGYSIVSYDEIKEFELNEAEVRLGINQLRFIKEFNIVFNLIELEDHIKGSFRSKKGIDVSLFAKELGGGGHKSASAFSLEKMPLEEAEKKVLDVIDKIGINH